MIDHVVVMAALPNHQLGSLTRTRPVALLPVVGRPLIARVMDAYYHAGARRFTVVVGETEGSVVTWLQEHWRDDAELSFAPQGHRRGTASTLFAARHLIHSPFVLAPCDILIAGEYAEALLRGFDAYPRDAAILSLSAAEPAEPNGANVLLNPRGQVMLVTERPLEATQHGLNALPIYALTPLVLDYLDRVTVEAGSGQHPLTVALQGMIDDGLLVGGVQTDSAQRVDSPQALRAANIAILSKQKHPALWSSLPPSVKVANSVAVDPGVQVGEGVELGPNVYLERGTTVGAGARLSNTVVLGRRIGPGVVVEDNVVNEDRRNES